MHDHQRPAAVQAAPRAGGRLPLRHGRQEEGAVADGQPQKVSRKPTSIDLPSAGKACSAPPCAFRPDR